MNLLIRADASVEMGTGHVMRCLALAQAWNDLQGEVTFATVNLVSSLKERLLSERVKVTEIFAKPGSEEDARLTVEFARKAHARWIILDGYHFRLEYQKIIKESGLSLLLIDDLGKENAYIADIILNQNIYANQDLYTNRDSRTQLFLGTSYALLRREFIAWREWKRELPCVARNVLVTMGGSDPQNTTLKVIRALPEMDIDVKILIGAANPHLDSLENATSRSKFQLIVDSKNVPELMAWADAAISAGGSTAWELLCMGLPSIVVPLADNQEGITTRLQQANLVMSIEALDAEKSEELLLNKLSQLLLDRNFRTTVAQKSREMVDGLGAHRVALELLKV